MNWSLNGAVVWSLDGEELKRIIVIVATDIVVVELALLNHLKAMPSIEAI